MTPDEIRESFGPKAGMPASIFPPSLRMEVEKAALLAELVQAVKELIQTIKENKPVIVAADEPKVNLRKTSVG